jgi:hypothetical protein
MEAAGYSEAVLTNHQITWRHITEDIIFIDTAVRVPNLVQHNLKNEINTKS